MSIGGDPPNKFPYIRLRIFATDHKPKRKDLSGSLGHVENPEVAAAWHQLVDQVPCGFRADRDSGHGTLGLRI